MWMIPTLFKPLILNYVDSHRHIITNHSFSPGNSRSDTFWSLQPKDRFDLKQMCPAGHIWLNSWCSWDCHSPSGDGGIWGQRGLQRRWEVTAQVPDLLTLWQGLQALLAWGWKIKHPGREAFKCGLELHHPAGTGWSSRSFPIQNILWYILSRKWCTQGIFSVPAHGCVWETGLFGHTSSTVTSWHYRDVVGGQRLLGEIR